MGVFGFGGEFPMWPEWLHRACVLRPLSIPALGTRKIEPDRCDLRVDAHHVTKRRDLEYVPTFCDDTGVDPSQQPNLALMPYSGLI